ncbi:hypothetical protein pEaSNUABM9_00145 [Erwinia phage pEa_SNUABM_9]|nr:hypothetical protein pEaSNUABM9_00145 [Erwinia phage pEa_SNUABM_9]
MKVIINLTPDGKKGAWHKFSNKVFKKYQCVIRTMLPTEYKNQAKLITQRAFDPVWAPLAVLAGSCLVFEFNEADVEENAVSRKVEFSTVGLRLDETLARLKLRIDEEDVILMGEPWVEYTQEVKDAFHQFLEEELRVFVKQLWLDTVDKVFEISVQFKKG